MCEASQVLHGTIELLIHSGWVQVVSRSSDFSLYESDLVSFESDQQMLNKMALGYVKTLTYPIQIQGGQFQKRMKS